MRNRPMETTRLVVYSDPHCIGKFFGSLFWTGVPWSVADVVKWILRLTEKGKRKRKKEKKKKKENKKE